MLIRKMIDDDFAAQQALEVENFPLAIDGVKLGQLGFSRVLASIIKNSNPKTPATEELTKKLQEQSKILEKNWKKVNVKSVKIERIW